MLNKLIITCEILLSSWHNFLSLDFVHRLSLMQRDVSEAGKENTKTGEPSGQGYS